MNPLDRMVRGMDLVFSGVRLIIGASSEDSTQKLRSDSAAAFSAVAEYERHQADTIKSLHVRMSAIDGMNNGHPPCYEEVFRRTSGGS